MSKNIFTSVKKAFSLKSAHKVDAAEGLLRVNVTAMEKCYENEDLVGASVILKHLLEIYGTQKKKNHRLKGREFMFFILSSKHKDLKSVGYTHWQHINKIIHLNQSKPYPYHKENLRKAMDFFEKELKGIHVIDMEI